MILKYRLVEMTDGKYRIDAKLTGILGWFIPWEKGSIHYETYEEAHEEFMQYLI